MEGELHKELSSINLKLAKLDVFDVKLSSIEDQTKKTNGRVNELEKDRNTMQLEQGRLISTIENLDRSIKGLHDLHSQSKAWWKQLIQPILISAIIGISTLIWQMTQQQARNDLASDVLQSLQNNLVLEEMK